MLLTVINGQCPKNKRVKWQTANVENGQCLKNLTNVLKHKNLSN